jgi:hypothetical protein
MNSDSSSAIRALVPDDSSLHGATQSSNRRLSVASEQRLNGVSDPVLDEPSNRLIYLDEDAMRLIGLRLLNDRDGFVTLSNTAQIYNAKLGAINDANAIDAVFFAQRIWNMPNNETLMDIPPLPSITSSHELYPGVVIRARAFLRAKEDLRPGRLTLTRGNERLHVEMSNRGVLSVNRTFLCGRALYVVGQLRRLKPLSLAAAAVLLAQNPTKNR